MENNNLLPDGYNERLVHHIESIISHSNKAMNIAQEFMGETLEIGDDKIQITISSRTEDEKDIDKLTN